MQVDESGRHSIDVRRRERRGPVRNADVQDAGAGRHRDTSGASGPVDTARRYSGGGRAPPGFRQSASTLSIVIAPHDRVVLRVEAPALRGRQEPPDRAAEGDRDQALQVEPLALDARGLRVDVPGELLRARFRPAADARRGTSSGTGRTSVRRRAEIAAQVDDRRDGELAAALARRARRRRSGSSTCSSIAISRSLTRDAPVPSRCGRARRTPADRVGNSANPLRGSVDRPDSAAGPSAGSSPPSPRSRRTPAQSGARHGGGTAARRSADTDAGGAGGARFRPAVGRPQAFHQHDDRVAAGDEVVVGERQMEPRAGVDGEEAERIERARRARTAR